MNERQDVVIIGAGPAGLSAAAQAQEVGLAPLLLDEQVEAGGQIYRSVARVAAQRPADIAFLGQDYADGAALVRAAHDVDHRRGAVVWQIGPHRRGEGREIVWSEGGAARGTSARALILATGAMERPVPIPGWTLPGVTSVGALQVALKQSAICPGGLVVLAGSGPLLLLLADQYHRAGIAVSAILDTNPPGALDRAWPHVPAALIGGLKTMLKGLGLLRALGRSGVPVHRSVTHIRALGGDRVERVAFRDAAGEDHEIEASVLALHEGVIPNPQLTRALRLEERWNDRQRCFEPVVDAFGRSSEADVFIAGDGAGILGADAAAMRGRLAALAVATDLGVLSEASRDFRATNTLNRLTGQRWLRRFLDAMYPPPQWIGETPDDAIVCRCEEVTAGDLRAAAEKAQGPNQLKAYTRCGMGPCQGRMCGPTVTEILATAQRRAPGDVGSYRARFPSKPVTVGELAALDGA